MDTKVENEAGFMWYYWDAAKSTADEYSKVDIRGEVLIPSKKHQSGRSRHRIIVVSNQEFTKKFKNSIVKNIR